MTFSISDPDGSPALPWRRIYDLSVPAGDFDGWIYDQNRFGMEIHGIRSRDSFSGSTRISGIAQSLTLTPDAWAEKFESFERINSILVTNGNFDSCNSCKRLVLPAVYMSCMSQNFRLLHVSNLSVRNFLIFLIMYPGSLCSWQATKSWPRIAARIISCPAAWPDISGPSKKKDS